MRILKFARLDLLKTRKQWFVFLLAIGITAIMARSPEHFSPVFCFSYCMFLGMVVSTTPFLNGDRIGDMGFTQMLPAREGERVRGSFLFALLMLLAIAACSLCCIAFVHLVTQAVVPSPRALYPVILGLCILMTGLQVFPLLLFHKDTQIGLSLIRLIPAFLYLMLVNAGFTVSHDALPKISQLMIRGGGWPVLFLCLILYSLLARGASYIQKKRDLI